MVKEGTRNKIEGNGDRKIPCNHQRIAEIHRAEKVPCFGIDRVATIWTDQIHFAHVFPVVGIWIHEHRTLPAGRTLHFNNTRYH